MRKIATIILLLSALSASAQSWFERFHNPPSEASPWTFWYWMYGCVSDAGISADLRAMHDAGIHGFYLMPIKSVSDEAQFQGDSEQLSDNWWRHIDHTFHIADSLHLQMGIHFSDGFALGGGPWIKPEESMQRIVWSDTVVEVRNEELRIKNKDSSLIAVYAYPAKYYDPRKPKSSVAFPFRSADSCAITMTYDSIFTLRSVRIVTGGNNYQAHRFAIYASDDGAHFRFVRQLQPAR